MKVKYLIAAFAAMSAAAANAGPFGIEWGAPISSLRTNKVLSQFNFEIDAPTPNENFIFYSVRGTPELGVCDIAARSNYFVDDAGGALVKNAYASITAALDRKYGKGHLVDESIKGILLTKPQEFAESINTYQREISTYWYNVFGTGMVSLTIEALPKNVTYVSIGYFGPNHAACLKSMKAQSDSSL